MLSKLKDNSTCEDKTIIADNGLHYIICIPYSFIDPGLGVSKIKIYVWPLEIVVSGGKLIKHDDITGTKYRFISNDCSKTAYDKLTFVTINGYNYSGCFHFTVDANGKNKVYDYPEKILVEGGYLIKVADSTMRAGWNYKFIAAASNGKKEEDGKKTNGNGGNGNDEIIAGVDNSILIIAGLALFFLSSK